MKRSARNRSMYITGDAVTIFDDIVKREMYRGRIYRATGCYNVSLSTFISPTPEQYRRTSPLCNSIEYHRSAPKFWIPLLGSTPTLSIPSSLTHTQNGVYGFLFPCSKFLFSIKPELRRDLTLFYFAMGAIAQHSSILNFGLSLI